VTLRGARVALLEARLSEELAALFRRHGAEPHCCPAVREERRDCGAEVTALLDDLRRESSSVFVFSTGVGVDALFAGARNLEREEELAHAVRGGIAVCRGPKPLAALRRVGLGAAVNAKSPFTTDDLLEALLPVELAGRHLVLLHYGERNLPLVAALAALGARVRELLLYEWRLPEDLGPLRSLVAELAERRFAAVAFTSQIQARHLFQVAAEMGRAEALLEALRKHTLVAAVGPTCARALEELGAPPHVVPDNPKMGSMLTALAERFSQPGRPS
jgi:uroporphyrinogen-III synthase